MASNLNSGLPTNTPNPGAAVAAASTNVGNISTNSSSSSSSNPAGAGTNASTSSSTTNVNSNVKSNSQENVPILSKPRLLELLRDIDASAQLDADVADVLLQMADDFVEDIVKSSCILAKHRKGSRVELSDLQLILERKWNRLIPDFRRDVSK